MNQESDRARMHRLAAPRQSLEGKRRRRRSARIKVGRAELARESPDHTPRPSIEGMGPSIARLVRILKDAPLIAAGEAEEYDGSRFLQCGHCAELTRSGVKGAAHRETHQGSAPTQ